MIPFPILHSPKCYRTRQTKPFNPVCTDVGVPLPGACPEMRKDRCMREVSAQKLINIHVWQSRIEIIYYADFNISRKTMTK